MRTFEDDLIFHHVYRLIGSYWLQSVRQFMRSILWILPVLIATVPVCAADQKEIYLSMKEFDQIIDRAHSECANVDLDFSQGFYDCLDRKMQGIYIDTSTINKAN